MTGATLRYINRYSNKGKITDFNASVSSLTVLGEKMSTFLPGEWY